MVASGIVGKPVPALGGFYGMALDTFVLMFKPPLAWREFILQAWFVARVSRGGLAQGGARRHVPATQLPPAGAGQRRRGAAGGGRDPGRARAASSPAEITLQLRPDPTIWDGRYARTSGSGAAEAGQQAGLGQRPDRSARRRPSG